MNDLHTKLSQVFSGTDIEAGLEAEVALQWCDVVTSATVAFEGKKVSDEARNAWFEFYRPRFIKAITVNHRHLKKDIGHLSVKSVLLGQKAASLAGTGPIVTKDAALEAARKIECQAVTLFPELHWCAP